MLQKRPNVAAAWPDRRLLDLLGITLPIIQAPMAGANGLEMPLAVAQAGGLGSLACAPLDASGLRKLLRAVRDRYVGPLNINFFAHAEPQNEPERESSWLHGLSPYYRELGIRSPGSLTAGRIQPFDAERCEVVEEFAPTVVSFHFGLPEASLVARLKAAGSLIMSSATTVEEARWLAGNGCDVVIAQGIEAGGHRGMFLADDINSQMGTMSLVPQVADAVNVPVVAAGGIADGRGIASAFALGACGVQIGTAYLFTPEATISDVYRDSLHKVALHQTALTNVFSGRLTRTLVNRFVTQLGPITDTAPSFPKGFPAMQPLRAEAESKGSRDFSAHYCGQSAGLGFLTTARRLTHYLAIDAQRRMSWMGSMLSRCKLLEQPFLADTE